MSSLKKDVTDKDTKKQFRGKKTNSIVKENLSKKTVNNNKKNVNDKNKPVNKKNIKKRENIVKNEVPKRVDLKKYLTKGNITYFILAVLDIIFVIYMARKNVVNYVVILDEEIFVSKTKYLLFGRNYINLVIIAFFYIYTCLVTKFFLKKKITKKFLLWLFVILFVINILLFFIFTKKVY